MNCNSKTHATYPLAFTTYKCSELQVSFATKKLNCKVRRGSGRRRRLKAKGLRKINTIAPYSKNACKQHIRSN
jgi:hypothetical protein